jgi:predicted phage replisome organizer
MGEVQWIKLYIDIFDKRKINKIRRLPAGNDIILFWVMLLATAGKCNSGGMIFITERVPFTKEDLADEFDFEISTIELALNAFVEYDMISISEDGFISVNNWEKYQSTDRLAEIREYNRIAQQKSRAKKKLLQVVNDKSMTSQRCHDTEEEEEKDKDKEFLSFIRSDDNEEDDYVKKKVIEEGFELGTKDAEVYANELREAMKLEYVKDDIGQGVLFISEEQMAYLESVTSRDELNRYINIVVECERSGKKYKNKSHFQAILDMVAKDRKVKT